MRKLESNSDLFEYLVSLADALSSRGEHELASEVEFASRFASGSASEFLHYALEALKKVSATFATSEKPLAAEVSSVIAQIEDAFDAIGGA